ncbi:MAG: phosphomannomutase/phosphoglucomutase [Planctomycetia bacterium]|nr:phosphomannomutase/phosphoglucomutase [Planctomycetia bacterium]
MRWQIQSKVPYNSADYFEKTLITDNGFREYDVRWRLSTKANPNGEINPNGFVVLGRAFGTYVREVMGERKVVVGHDFREYSQNLSRSLVVGLLWSGVDVVDIGLALSPMLYFAQHRLNVKAGAMVTASHNENGWTGLKLADGLSSTLGPEGIQRFKEIVKKGDFSTGPGGYESYEDIFSAYADDIVAGKKLKHVVDVVLAAGNGTAGRFAPPVLENLGCNVVPIDCDLDWDFPHHNPNPEDVSFLRSIGKAARTHDVKIGIGIDGDGDRIGVVDDTGQEVYSDKVALLVARWLARQTPGRNVVIDVKSTGLFLSDPVLQETGTKVIMVATGHSYVKAAVAKHQAIAGFERSGHWFFNAPFGRGYDDAVQSAAQLLRMLDESGVSLSKMLKELPRTWQSPTIGVVCPDDVKYALVAEMTGRYESDLKSRTPIAGTCINNLIDVNGVRFVMEDNSWGLIRASSNKPSLVLVAESPNSESQAYQIMMHIQHRLEATGKVGEYDQQMSPPAAM